MERIWLIIIEEPKFKHPNNAKTKFLSKANNFRYFNLALYFCINTIFIINNIYVEYYKAYENNSSSNNFLMHNRGIEN